MISLWNTFNHSLWVFNVTKLSDWRKQAYLHVIQTNSALSRCECVRFLYTKPDYVDYYPDKPFKLWHSIYILSSKSTSWWLCIQCIYWIKVSNQGHQYATDRLINFNHTLTHILTAHYPRVIWMTTNKLIWHTMQNCVNTDAAWIKNF